MSSQNHCNAPVKSTCTSQRITRGTSASRALSCQRAGRTGISRARARARDIFCREQSASSPPLSTSYPKCSIKEDRARMHPNVTRADCIIRFEDARGINLGLKRYAQIRTEYTAPHGIIRRPLTIDIDIDIPNSDDTAEADFAALR